MAKETLHCKGIENIKTSDLVDVGGILLDVEGRSTSLKTAKDGHLSIKKHLILLPITWGALRADFTSPAKIPRIFSQGAQLHMDPNTVSYANNLIVLMMGIGGILWITTISFWGRDPILLWACVCGTFLTLGSALSPDFTTHCAMRATMRLFLTAPQTISIAYIRDIFFFHEHARKIGLWVCLYVSSPYSGPLFANFINTSRTATASWLQDSSTRGCRQIRNHTVYFYTLGGAIGRLVATITKLALLLLLIGYSLTFMWSIGINITSAIRFATPLGFGGYGFSSISIGYLYFAPIVAVIIGEIFGHFFNDCLTHCYIHKHRGVFELEVRHKTVYLSMAFMVPGLILLGFALTQHLLYGVIGGFSVGYYQQPWGRRVGYDASFGTQAAIIGLSLVSIALLHRCGKNLRFKGRDIN